MTEEKAMESGNLSPLCGTEERDQVCGVCNSGYKQPRLLACLHIYCETCLETTLEKQLEGKKSQVGMLECPECGHKTKLVGRGVVDSCPLEHLLVNELDRAALETLSMVCTSCKAKEAAVARCTDCVSFLCNNCVTAHRYMRCFESHAVLTFDELAGPSPDQMADVHRPLLCPTHAGELLKHYCLTCQETFEKYKSLLEKRQQELLEELETLHSEEELHIMDSLHEAEKTSEHIEAACRFGDRLLVHANAVELLSLKQLVSTRLKSLVAGIPQLETPGEMSFVFDLDQFESALVPLCGQLRKPRGAAPEPSPQAPPSASSPTPSSASPGGALGGNASPIHSAASSLAGGTVSPLHSAASSLGNGGAGGIIGASMGGVGGAGMSPLHSATPASSLGAASLSPPPLHASSLDDAAAGGGDPFAALSAPLDVGLLTSAAAQYNLARLANMAEGPDDSETSADVPVTMADLLMDPSLGVSAMEQNVLNNLTALAKLGSVSLNNSDTCRVG